MVFSKRKVAIFAIIGTIIALFYKFILGALVFFAIMAEMAIYNCDVFTQLIVTVIE